MKRLIIAICALAGATAGQAAAADVCVGSGAGCFPTLQAAVTASSDGDTVHVGAGTFAGGVTIDKSITLAGAGAGASIISGGGPVLTIFRATASDQLSVAIKDVTVTGGVNDSSPDGAVTFGGGISIPVAQLAGPPFNGTGASVRIDETVITGNVVRSTDVIPPGFCGPFVCGFNSGGGIDNGGVLTLVDSRVTNNTAGSTPSLATLATDVSAGGISTHFASTLVMRRTVVSGNRASATLPNGQEAVAGGIVTQGAVTIEHSEVSDNVAEVEGAQAGDEEQVALAGGIKVGEDSDFPPPTAILRDTVVRGNRAVTRVEGAGTLAVAFAGGVLAEAPLLIERTRITDNLAHAVSGGDAVADGGGLEIDSAVTIRDSIVARNVVAVDAAGAAGAVGGGIANAGDLTVERTTISGNRAHASGAGGLLPFGEASAALGGGIWNGSFGGPLPTLTVRDSAIVANALDAPAGFIVQGGGIYSAFPITLMRTALAGNRPDQCVGC